MRALHRLRDRPARIVDHDTRRLQTRSTGRQRHVID